MAIQSILFGFGYRARSGKDTAAAEIVAKRNSSELDVRSYSFAAELKREVNENAMKSGGMIRLFDPGLYEQDGGYMQTNGNILRLPEWVQYDPNPDMTDPLCPYGKQRTLLQWWGTEYRRNVETDYWVKRLAARLEEEQPEIALITDMRFPNEINFVEEYGDTIKVNRPGLPPATHASETVLDSVPDNDWDFILENDSTLEDFKERAVKMFDYLMDKVR